MKKYIKSAKLPNEIDKFTLDDVCEDSGVDYDEAASWYTDRPADDIKFLYERADGEGAYTGIEFVDGTFSVVGGRIDKDNIDYDYMIDILLEE